MTIAFQAKDGTSEVFKFSLFLVACNRLVTCVVAAATLLVSMTAIPVCTPAVLPQRTAQLILGIADTRLVQCTFKPTHHCCLLAPCDLSAARQNKGAAPRGAAMVLCISVAIQRYSNHLPVRGAQVGQLCSANVGQVRKDVSCHAVGLVDDEAEVQVR